MSQIERFSNLMAGICKRPGMYLVNNVEDIWLVVFGFLAAHPDEELDKFLVGFRNHVNDHYAKYILQKEVDWARLIRFHSGGDKHTIEIFQDLFKSYMSSQGIDWKLPIDQS